MLVLSRKENQSIHIGNHIKVHVIFLTGKRVKLGIEAPPGMTIIRNELGEADLEPIETQPKAPTVASETKGGSIR